MYKIGFFDISSLHDFNEIYTKYFFIISNIEFVTITEFFFEFFLFP